MYFFKLLTTLMCVNAFFCVGLKANDKVLFILSADKHGYYLPEVVAPFEHLKSKGFGVDFSSPQGSIGHPAAYNRLSEGEKKTYQEIIATTNIGSPFKLVDVKADDYVAFYVPGGAGPMFDLAQHPELKRLSLSFLAQNKIISAVCHGPAAFVGITDEQGKFLLEGVKVTAKSNAEEGAWARENYPFLLEDMFKAQGAHFSFAPPGEPYVVYDKGILTGQNPKSALPTAQRLAELLLIR